MERNWQFYWDADQVHRDSRRILDQAAKDQARERLDAYRRSTAIDRAESAPYSPAIKWGSLGCGGAVAFLLGILVVFVGAFVLSCALSRATRIMTTPKPAPHHGASKHPHPPRKPHHLPPR